MVSISGILRAVYKRIGTRRRRGNIWDQEFNSGKWDGLKVPADVVSFLMARLAGGGELLDMGCGPGLLEQSLRSMGWQGSYTGVDISGAAIERARSDSGHANSSWVCSDLAGYSPGHRYDAIVFVESIYYLTPPSAFRLLLEMKRCLNPGGELIVRIWNPRKHRMSVAALRMACLGRLQRSGDSLYVYRSEAAKPGETPAPRTP